MERSVHHLCLNLISNVCGGVVNTLRAGSIRKVLIGSLGPISISQLIVFLLVVLNVEQDGLLFFNGLSESLFFSGLILDHLAYPQLFLYLFGLDIPLEDNSHPDLRLARYELLSDIINNL